MPWICFLHHWAPSQYPKRRLFVRSRKVSKPRDWYFKLPYGFEIWQAHRQHCCRSACQISERSDNSKYKSRDFEILRDLTERRLFGYWDGALVPCKGHRRWLVDSSHTGSVKRTPGGSYWHPGHWHNVIPRVARLSHSGWHPYLTQAMRSPVALSVRPKLVCSMSNLVKYLLQVTMT